MHGARLSQSLALSKLLRNVHCCYYYCYYGVWTMTLRKLSGLRETRLVSGIQWHPKAPPKVARQLKPDCHREQPSLGSLATDAIYCLCFIWQYS